MKGSLRVLWRVEGIKASTVYLTKLKGYVSSKEKDFRRLGLLTIQRTFKSYVPSCSSWQYHQLVIYHLKLFTDDGMDRPVSFAQHIPSQPSGDARRRGSSEGPRTFPQKHVALFFFRTRHTVVLLLLSVLNFWLWISWRSTTAPCGHE